jgi:hypothetical protein
MAHSGWLLLSLVVERVYNNRDEAVKPVSLKIRGVHERHTGKLV